MAEARVSPETRRPAAGGDEAGVRGVGHGRAGQRERRDEDAPQRPLVGPAVLAAQGEPAAGERHQIRQQRGLPGGFRRHARLSSVVGLPL